MTDGLGTTTHAYDLLDRRTSTTDPFGQVVGYGYDANGNRTSLTYPGAKTVTYAYDAANRMTTVTDWLGNLDQLQLRRRQPAHRHRQRQRHHRRLQLRRRRPPDRAHQRQVRRHGHQRLQLHARCRWAITCPRTAASRCHRSSPPRSSPTPTTPRIGSSASNSLPNAFDANGNMTAKGTNTYAYDQADRLIETNIDGTQTQYAVRRVGQPLRAYPRRGRDPLRARYQHRADQCVDGDRRSRHAARLQRLRPGADQSHPAPMTAPGSITMTRAAARLRSPTEPRTRHSAVRV